MDFDCDEFNFETKKIFVGSSLSDVDIFLKNHVKYHDGQRIVNFSEETLYSLAKKIVTYYLDNLSIIDDKLSTLILFNLLSNQKTTNNKIFDVIPVKSLSLSTSKMILETINKVRTGRNILLNEQVNTIINIYENKLTEEKFLDKISVMKMAVEYLSFKEDIDKALPLGDKVKFILLPNLENKLTYLENNFYNLLCKKFNQIDRYVLELPKNVNKKCFVTAYGYSTEVNYVISKIKNDKLNVNDVSIYVSDQTYNNLIKSLFELNGIPYYFSNGENCFNSEIICLINQILDFYENNYSIKDLSRIYNNKSIYGIKRVDENNTELDIIYSNKNELANLKASREYILFAIQNREKWTLDQHNFLFDLVSFFDLSSNISEFFDTLLKFLYNYTNSIELNMIVGELERQRVYFEYLNKFNYTLENCITFVRQLISTIKVSYNKSGSYILIKELKNSNYLERKYNFFLGLSASQIEEKAYDSPLVSDEELYRCLDQSCYIEYSKNKNKEIESNIDFLSTSYPVSKIYFVYSCYDSVQFKPNAPWAKLLNMAFDENDMIGYSKDSTLSYKFNENNNNFDFKLFSSGSMEKVCQKMNCLNATNINTLMNCPISFLLNIIYDKEVFDEYSATWLNALDEGNFVHEVFKEYFTNNPEFSNGLNKEDYKRIINLKKNEYKANIPFKDEKIQLAVLSRLEKMTNLYLEKLYNNINNSIYRVLFCEKSMYCDLKVGENKTQKIFGVLDRVDGMIEDGILYLRIVDYKTSNPKDFTKKHNSQSYIYKKLLTNYVETKHDYFKDLFNADFDSYKIDFEYVLLKDLNKKININEEALETDVLCSISLIYDAIKDNTWNGFINCFDVYNRPKKDDPNSHVTCLYCKQKKNCFFKKIIGEDAGI